jgi:aminopeptidase
MRLFYFQRCSAPRDPSPTAPPGWLYEGMAKAFAGNAARLAIAGDNPMLLSGEDPDKVARANKANSMAYQPALEKITGFDINWNIVPTRAVWAKQVFPDATRRTWPWQARRGDLRGLAGRPAIRSRPGRAQRRAQRPRTAGSTARISPLHFTGPGTDLTVGLADGHEWQGGASTAKNGITCNPNIPTEEVFTTPHARASTGRVRSTKPLSYQGTLIDEHRGALRGRAASSRRRPARARRC